MACDRGTPERVACGLGRPDRLGVNGGPFISFVTWETLRSVPCDYRVLCDLREEELLVPAIEVGHRREAYK